MDASRVHVAREDAGSIGLPDEYRDALGITLGDEVVVVIEENELRVMTRAEALRRIQQMVCEQVPPDRSLAEELSRERRAEAEYE